MKKNIGTMLRKKGRKKRKKAELKEREFIYITTRKSVDTPLKLELNGRKFKEEFAIQIQIYFRLVSENRAQ